MAPSAAERRRFEPRLGAPLFLGHLLVCVLVQAESYAVMHGTPGLDRPDLLAFAASFPFLQLEHVAASLVPGLLGAAGRRVAGHLALLVLNLWVVLDQVAFLLFFHHADPAMDESQLTDLVPMLRSLWDSAVSEGGLLLAFNLVIVAVVSITCLVRRPGARLGRGATDPRLRAAAAAWLLASVAVTVAADHRGLEQHASFSLVRALWRDPPPPADLVLSKEEILAATFDVASEEAASDAALLAALEGLRRGGRPNVLLVMMESVGSLQVFSREGARVDPELTPNLARLVAEGVTFTDLYTTFPATIRALIGLHTGGATITWGNVHFELGFPYTGPTLVSRFRALGYRTALYSAGDMNFENMNDYLAGLGFDALIDAGRQPDAWRERHAIHSWGVADDAMRGDALRWMLARHAAGEPFLLEYITVSTHHPYGVPPGIPPRFPGDDALSRYRSALHYSDGFLGRLLEELRLNGLLEKTLVVVTGDHGQAFGRRHPGNLLHKNGLYEENVKTFAILSAPGSGLAPVASPRVGALGDLLPTLLRVVGDDFPDFWGQSLWPGDYEPRIAYFHKSAPPEAWGLREGRYKFIARRDGGEPELYDLQADPEEQRNLATSNRTQTRRYQELCSQWYAATNAAFVARLEGYAVPGGTLQPSEVASPGPKRLAVGLRDEDGRGRPAESITPNDQVIAWSFWVPHAEPRDVEFRWTSPSGARFLQRARIAASQHTLRAALAAPRPLEPGGWRVEVRDGAGAAISSAFQVARAGAEAPPAPLPRR